ncbi:hypothetical protein [Limnoglobus roseus]|uniref:Zinc ribbon domain-containing protein n=1 Tax=Limnoglobus roseus TaxID=2598579 RepID=A0A5C1AA27_9BACT|nr:hypothetical protein [Limnoglobus roseus]QEL16061.1 hypothetical protein PX52LOC_03000 [Limnoglobus roseus]
MPTPMPVQSVSPGRTIAYYSGVTLFGLGMLLCLLAFLQSAFATKLPDVRTTKAHEGADSTEQTAELTRQSDALIGAVKRRLAERETAATLGFWGVNAAFVGAILSQIGRGRRNFREQAIVKMRCQGCSALNDEAAKYCGQCGQAV